MTPPRRPNRMLAALLAEADWTARDLARAVNALGSAQGLRLRYDRTSVARWLGGARPRPPVGHLIGQALSRRLGRRLTPRDAGFPDPDLTGGALSSALHGGDPVHRLAALCRAEADPARRAELARAVLSAPPPVVAGWGRRPVALPPADPRAPQASAAAPVRLEVVAARSVLLGERHGGAHGRSALAGYLATEVVPLLTAPAHQAVRHALLSGAAHLTLLLAGRTSETGHPALAQHYYDIALELARAAGDLGSYAIVLRCLSVQAHQFGDHHQALALGEAATEIAGSAVPSAVRAYLYAGRAVVRAGAGESRAAAADLLAAEQHLARATGPEGPFTSYPETALRYQRAEVLSCLGDHKSALTELENSLASRPADHHKARTLLHAQLAHTLIALHDVDAAVDHSFQALRHHRQLAAGSVHGTLPRLAHRLAPYQRNPHVKAFRERLRTTAR
ncbi:MULTISPECIES: hypothetical protein [Streptomyces]|uniref:hypothetical protein n=1 Tax=Streptomyces TaxID=1883 RepID=UPI0019652800|nr:MULTISPECIES: hypothetical protein [Streptomyces]QRX90009.1 hypothetical protein JNO44_03270 [Streptomyces noursei]UJB39945.1 hypothetical protein HRD51_02710 [Streptomyces sp. A1-5]